MRRNSEIVKSFLGYVLVMIVFGLLAYFLYIIHSRVDPAMHPIIDTIPANPPDAAPAPVGCPSSDCKG